ncbi:PREDICTED: serine protease HTRA2, mitochondrial-like [Nicrophorus vespilloides]|uniref:Serine protease HTRA2, mitochondrial n=1 Tax=Nicrophorus vespilloides TaxID=110193 RepID=A0ABM1MM37_NICVS|nr:PREDICTED: serine protease HTRA2, mitochondrial-like [Nicrophorus vespilloides]
MNKILRRCLRSNVFMGRAKYSSGNVPKRTDLSPVKLFCGATVISSICATIYTYIYHSPRKKLVTHPPELDQRRKFNFINRVVEQCAPAVVYVEIKDPKRIDKSTEDRLIVSNGSGFIVREDGWILTNAHVVINKPNSIINVKMRDGSSFQGKVEEADMNIDLALIKVDPGLRRLPALNLADVGDVNVGEWVVALGSPLSLSHSATVGVVSCVNRTADELGLRNYQMKYIQTDAPITFGNSGGPLVNLNGDVIGINNLRITAGISFAIPIEYVSKFLDRIDVVSKRKPPKNNNLGITTMSMKPSIAKEALNWQNGLEESNETGLFVWKVLDGGLAMKGGIRTGDIITHINDRPVKKPSDLYSYFNRRQTTNSVQVLRLGKRTKIVIGSDA